MTHENARTRYGVILQISTQFLLLKKQSEKKFDVIDFINYVLHTLWHDEHCVREDMDTLLDIWHEWKDNGTLVACFRRNTDSSPRQYFVNSLGVFFFLSP